MAWVLEDYGIPLRIGERQLKFSRLIKENLQAEEEKRKKAEEQLETKGAELKGAHIELTAAQAEVAQLKEDALMEVSWLQARAKDAESKMAGVPGEIAATKIVALSEY